MILLGESPGLVVLSSQSAINSSVSMLHLDPQANELGRKNFGGQSNDYLVNAKYIPGLGIVITGWTNSFEGDLVTDSRSGQWQDYLALVNMDFEIVWLHQGRAFERFAYDQLVADVSGIYMLGSSPVDEDSEGLMEDKQLFITKYDLSGEQEFKTYCQEHKAYTGLLSVDRYSKIVVGSGSMNTGLLSYYDKNGQSISGIKELDYAPRHISPLDDGGYLVKSIREIKSIAQPIFISSIWFDHEVLFEKYDENNNLVWRRIFNDYDDMRIDSIHFFEN